MLPLYETIKVMVHADHMQHLKLFAARDSRSALCIGGSGIQVN